MGVWVGLKEMDKAGGNTPGRQQSAANTPDRRGWGTVTRTRKESSLGEQRPQRTVLLPPHPLLGLPISWTIRKPEVRDAVQAGQPPGQRAGGDGRSVDRSQSDGGGRFSFMSLARGSIPTTPLLCVPLSHIFSSDCFSQQTSPFSLILFQFTHLSLPQPK